MARPRVPTEKAAVTGAARVNPGRFKKRADPETQPLGDPSSWMNKMQRCAWECFRAELPWLMESDRTVVEVASTIRARLMAGEDIGVSAINQLRMCAAQMGATPADRSKVNIPHGEEEDEDDRFYN